MCNIANTLCKSSEFINPVYQISNILNASLYLY